MDRFKLAEKFGEFCGKLYEQILPTAQVHAIDGRHNLYIAVDTVDIPDVALWWDATHKNDYLAQQDLVWGIKPELYNVMMESSFHTLHANPNHIEEYEAARVEADKRGYDDFAFMQFLPHQIGMLGSDYGAELFARVEYQELTMAGKVLNLDIAVHLTTDPEKPRLREAFRLCMDISTGDQSPILPRILSGQQQGVLGNRPKGIH